MQTTFRTPSRALERYPTWIGSPELRRAPAAPAAPARAADDRLGHPTAVGRYVCAGVVGRGRR
ncbi:hypothetical protein [Pseudonocardia parietis]|uniref:Nucleoid-associated protein YgaU n=1 Tax=Pseudonocardia parietis TaxID=570936 RepID=A0ABS4W0P0_9PSEU|nr:hypothetical protein [Pseudonocardia parietis]MBP2369765.1 nucleoid-associated protein YgaU [Pseudonocardia parietis]